MTQAKKNSGAVDMLSGNLVRNMLLFAIPLFFSGFLQQSFNAVDIIVVGRWTGHEALAAVGNNGVVISLIVNLFIGISVGANVVIANLIGRRNDDGVGRSVVTSTVMAVVSGVFLMFVTLAIARPLLQWLDTPPEVLDMAVLYLRIFALGLPFLMLYNFGSAILRSMGDTKRPFYALVISGIINAALNLLLVIVFEMGVSGVAIATVVANVINGGLIVLYMRRMPVEYRPQWKMSEFSFPAMRKILRIGVPAGLQGMVFSLSNVFILGAINSFGAEAAAGSSTALNYEYYCYFAISAFTQSAVAFTSQNYGAGRLDRIRRIFRVSMLLSVATAGFMNIFIAMNHGFFAGIFTTDPEVIHYASIRMEYVLMLQFVASSYEIAGAVMRGLGYSLLPALLTILGTCVVRLVWVWWITAFDGTFAQLMIAYPATWCLTGVMVLAAYRHVARRLLTRRPEPEPQPATV